MDIIKKFNSKWIQYIVKATSVIYKKKQLLLTTHGIRSISVLIHIVILEIYLALLSIPVYLFIESNRLSDDYGVTSDGVHTYRIRRTLTLTGMSLTLILIAINVLFSTVVPLIFLPAEQTPAASDDLTAFSFQRKNWFDGNLFWKSNYSPQTEAIIFSYSEDGLNWSVNARAVIKTKSPDYSIDADGKTLAIAYKEGKNVAVLLATDASRYPGKTFGWTNRRVTYQANTDEETYMQPTVSIVNPNNIWVAATKEVSSGIRIQHIKAIIPKGKNEVTLSSPKDFRPIKDTSKTFLIARNLPQAEAAAYISGPKTIVIKRASTDASDLVVNLSIVESLKNEFTVYRGALNINSEQTSNLAEVPKNVIPALSTVIENTIVTNLLPEESPVETPDGSEPPVDPSPEVPSETPEVPPETVEETEPPSGADPAVEDLPPTGGEEIPADPSETPPDDQNQEDDANAPNVDTPTNDQNAPDEGAIPETVDEEVLGIADSISYRFTLVGKAKNAKSVLLERVSEDPFDAQTYFEIITWAPDSVMLNQEKGDILNGIFTEELIEKFSSQKFYTFNVGSLSESQFGSKQITESSLTVNPYGAIESLNSKNLFAIWSQNEKIVYSVNNQGSWITKPVTIDSAPKDLSDGLSIANDPSRNRIYLAYKDEFHNVKLATNTGGVWSAPKIIRSSAENNYLSVAVSLIDTAIPRVYIFWSGPAGVYYRDICVGDQGVAWGEITALDRGNNALWLNSINHSTEKGFVLSWTDSRGSSGYGVESKFINPLSCVQLPPTATDVVLNGGKDINLSAGQFKDVPITFRAEDPNGFSEITSMSSKVYRSGVENDENCVLDNNNCYITTDCEKVSCTEKSCEIVCTVKMAFHSDPTDSGSEFEAEDWVAKVKVQDAQGEEDVQFNSGSIDVMTLKAIETRITKDFSTIYPGSDSGDNNEIEEITNVGNTAIDVQITVDPLCPDYPQCQKSIIDPEYQQFSTEPFRYGEGIAYKGTPVKLDLNLPKPVMSPSISKDKVYWGVQLPLFIESGNYEGGGKYEAIDPL